MRFNFLFYAVNLFLGVVSWQTINTLTKNVITCCSIQWVVHSKTLPSLLMAQTTKFKLWLSQLSAQKLWSYLFKYHFMWFASYLSLLVAINLWNSWSHYLICQASISFCAHFCTSHSWKYCNRRWLSYTWIWSWAGWNEGGKFLCLEIIHALVKLLSVSITWLRSTWTLMLCKSSSTALDWFFLCLCDF